MKRTALAVVLGILPAICAASETELVTRYLKYREMLRLTMLPIDVVASTLTLCRDPRDIQGPHLKPGIHIYANSTAIAAAQKISEPRRYPIGTLIVKEKFEDKEATSPSLITVMEKIANIGQVDDWRFTMIRLSDRVIVRDGFKVSCVECHSRYAKTDFVSPVTDRLLAPAKRETNPPRP